MPGKSGGTFGIRNKGLSGSCGWPVEHSCQAADRSFRGVGGSGPGLPGGPSISRMGLGDCCPPTSCSDTETEDPRQHACRSDRGAVASARPGFPSWFPLSGSVALASHDTFPSLSFFTFKAEVIILTSWGCVLTVKVPRNTSPQSFPKLLLTSNSSPTSFVMPSRPSDLCHLESKVLFNFLCLLMIDTFLQEP